MKNLAGVKTTTTESLLGLLSFGPKSGYELRHLIESSVGNFWSESFGQIYPALKQMVTDGLVTVSDKANGGREKKVYRLTAAGRALLRKWVTQPAERQAPRNALLLKIFFASEGSLECTKQQVTHHRAQLVQEREHYAEIERDMVKARKDDPRMPFWRMTVRYGMAENAALIAWCDESLKTLEGMS